MFSCTVLMGDDVVNVKSMVQIYRMLFPPHICHFSPISLLSRLMGGKYVLACVAVGLMACLLSRRHTSRHANTHTSPAISYNLAALPSSFHPQHHHEAKRWLLKPPNASPQNSPDHSHQSDIINNWTQEQSLKQMWGIWRRCCPILITLNKNGFASREEINQLVPPQDNFPHRWRNVYIIKKKELRLFLHSCSSKLIPYFPNKQATSSCDWTSDSVQMYILHRMR